MAQVESRVMDWTLEQWAEVAGFVEDRCEWLPLPDCAGAEEARSVYVTHRAIEPAGTLLWFAAGVKPMNFAWARRMFRAVAIECAAWGRLERRSGKDRRRG